jgi:type VI secretion system protein ImpJ
MASNSLHWSEGLFLRPHHFQCMERQFHDSRHLSETWATPNHYGLHRIEVELDALSNWQVALASCHVRFRDGTQLRVPEDAHLSAITIPKHLFPNSETRVRVYLGIAELRRGTANVGHAAADPPPRYVTHSEETEDENRAGNPQELQFRKLNPRLLIGEHADQGFDAVPIMQLRLGATAEAPPEIDPDYIPPILCQEAWPALAGFVRSVYNRLGATAEKMATQMIDRGVAFGTGHREDLERVLHLHALNTALGGVAPLPVSRGIHPFAIYRELCRAVGALAIFRSERRIAELPVYDHDNLAPCFDALRRLLEVKAEADASYIRVPFATQGLQMSVRLQADWLEPTWSFFIGVESSMENSRVNELLSAKELDMKAGSSEEVDNIYRRGRRGVRLVTATEVPRVFPRKDWHYFKVDRDEVWKTVERSLNLGLRFNEKKLEKQAAGANTIDIVDRDTGAIVTLSFSLFAVRSS